MEPESIPFSSWLAEMDAALAGRADACVPCGDCTACCTASQFVHVGPEEGDSLAHIPAQLLFPAPGLPPGHVLLGYDEGGRCPMLEGAGCSVYPHRPRTCRTYDCRVFAAAGIEPEGASLAHIAEQARRWRFSYPNDADRVRHDAVWAAARFLAEHPEVVPDATAPLSDTRRAVLAVVIRGAFLTEDPSTGRVTLREPSVESVRAEVLHRRG